MKKYTYSLILQVNTTWLEAQNLLIYEHGCQNKSKRTNEIFLSCALLGKIRTNLFMCQKHTKFDCVLIFVSYFLCMYTKTNIKFLAMISVCVLKCVNL